MWLKLLLLALYVLLLFFWARLFDAAMWYHGGSTNFFLDPLSLSVRQLKQILDNRGVSYAAVVEKQELVSYVHNTGDVTETELEEAAEEDKKHSSSSRLQSSSSVVAKSTRFTCGTHFYEEVEDNKDSVWLVQVVPVDGRPLLDDLVWRKVVTKVSRFGIRTGIFECSLDKRLCSRKGWVTPQLILALPRGNQAKEDVVLHSYYNLPKYQLVISWIHNRLASHIKEIQHIEELEELLTYKNSLQSSEIRVILISLMAEPPLFLSALAIKFTGRIRFGMTKIKKRSLSYYCKTTLGLQKFPTYMVVMPEKRLIYGNNQGENLNFKSMEIYLKTLWPEMNDIFQLSLWLTNLTVSFQLFLYSSKLWKHILYCFLQFVKYNCALFLLWLLILGLNRFSFMEAIIDSGLKLSRHLSWTRLASILRKDIKYLSFSLFTVSYALFGTAVALSWRNWGYTEDHEGLSLFSDWWTSPWDTLTVNHFFRPMTSITRPTIPLELDLEEGMELLIERLAVPNLWLQPVIQTDYIKDLPIWRYKKASTEDLSPAEAEDLSLHQSSVVDDSQEATYESSPFQDYPQYVEGLSEEQQELLLDHQQHQQSVGYQFPKGMLISHDCAICLESYQHGVLLCGLPCGHNYHHSCILMWLSRDNHCCPKCRWPSFRTKPSAQQHPHSS